MTALSPEQRYISARRANLARATSKARDLPPNVYRVERNGKVRYRVRRNHKWLGYANTVDGALKLLEQLSPFANAAE